jgi:hypothetical protein
VFAHPHIFLITRGLVDPAQTLQIASLSAEPRCLPLRDMRVAGGFKLCALTIVGSLCRCRCRCRCLQSGGIVRSRSL